MNMLFKKLWTNSLRNVLHFQDSDDFEVASNDGVVKFWVVKSGEYQLMSERR